MRCKEGMESPFDVSHWVKTVATQKNRENVFSRGDQVITEWSGQEPTNVIIQVRREYFGFSG